MSCICAKAASAPAQPICFVCHAVSARASVVVILSNHTIGPHTRKIARKKPYNNVSAAASAPIWASNALFLPFIGRERERESERAGARRLHNACKSGALRHTACIYTCIQKQVTSTMRRAHTPYTYRPVTAKIGLL